MRVVKHWVKDEKACLIPISDVHLGSKDLTPRREALLKSYVNWIAGQENARATLIGDIMNCATRQTKSNPIEELYGLAAQKDRAEELFTPIRDKILCASEGWHETKMEDFCGDSPTKSLCKRLGIPYAGYSGVIIFQLGVRDRGAAQRESPDVFFTIYQHHTTGGGNTPGGKINRVEKLREIVPNADIYLGAHNHSLQASRPDVFIVHARSGRIETRRQYLVNTGGYIEWNGSYAERMQLPPFTPGSAKVKLYAKNRRKDVHVSL